MRLVHLVPAVLVLACSGSMPPPSARVPDAARSKVLVSRPMAVADGNDTVQVSVTVLDATGAPIVGAVVEAVVSGDGNTIDSPRNTNEQGEVLLPVRSTRAGAKTVSVTANAVALEPKPTVTFAAGPLAELRWETQPTNGRLGQALTPPPALAAFDTTGNPVGMTDVTVTLTLVRSQNGTLAGNAAKPFTQGVARFDQLVITGAPQTGCALRAVASNGSATESARFDVGP
jgi:hypothetical protein